MSVATRALELAYRVENELRAYKDVPDSVLDELTSYLKSEIHAESLKANASLGVATAVKTIENFLEKQKKLPRTSFAYMHEIELYGSKYQSCTNTHICFCFLDSFPVQKKYIAPSDFAYPDIERIIPKSYNGMTNVTVSYGEVKSAIALSKALDKKDDNRNYIALSVGDMQVLVNHSYLEMCFKVFQTKELNVFLSGVGGTIIIDDGTNKAVIAPVKRTECIGHMGAIEC